MSSLFLSLKIPTSTVDSCPIRCNFYSYQVSLRALPHHSKGNLTASIGTVTLHSQPPLRCYSSESTGNLKIEYLICAVVQHRQDRFFMKRGSTFNKIPGPGIYFNQGPVTCSLNSIGANEDFESATSSIIRTFLISYCCGRCYFLWEAQLHCLWCGYIPFWRGSTNLSVYA